MALVPGDGLGCGRQVTWLGTSTSKFYNWRKRCGKVNEHNSRIPRRENSLSRAFDQTRFLYTGQLNRTSHRGGHLLQGRFHSASLALADDVLKAIFFANTLRLNPGIDKSIFPK